MEKLNIGIQNSKKTRALARLAGQLNLSVTVLWHPLYGNGDVLIGYSRVPFMTWALAKGEEFLTSLSSV